MITEILCIGTEILIGDILNTNATYLSKRLSENGFDVLYHTACGDNPQRVKNCLKTAFSRSDMVVTTGGLGPTYDDLTLKVCADYFGLELYTDESIVKFLVDYFAKTNRVMTENNYKQALVPKGAKVFTNDWGTAPGICIEKDQKVLVMLPGPPRENKPMFENAVLPYISKYSNEVLLSTNINILGIGESAVETKLAHIMTNAVNPSVAPYVNDGEVRIRVSCSAKNVDIAKSKISPIVQEIKDILGDNVYDVDSDSIQSSLVKILKQKNLKIATAESCTGGMISQMITDVPGSSAVFDYGFCTYANQAKINMLGVNPDTINKYGAVSENTACEMASGLKKVTGADIAISVTGIAGPAGGTDEKPVGLVYIGVAVKDQVYANKFLLARHNSPSRNYIRTLAAKNALKIAIDQAMRF